MIFNPLTTNLKKSTTNLKKSTSQNVIFILLAFAMFSPSSFAEQTFLNDSSDASYFLFANFFFVNIGMLILLSAGGFFYWKKYKQLESLKNFYAVAIKYNFDESIKAAMNDSELKRNNLINDSKDIFDDEHRFSIRVPVSPGALVVYWKDECNNIQSGNAIDISMHGIKFNCNSLPIKTIDQIVCPELKTSFILNKSSVRQNDQGTAVAAIETFQNDTKDQIRWIELITNLYQPQESLTPSD